jgi:Ca2+-binding EF-hand superfamily protein
MLTKPDKETVPKLEIEQMIWEVDEDLDEQVNFYEFQLMYKRCI